ncbi:hypothetical protein L7H23_05450 [Sphingopyxis sp. BSN-002]|uniref:hypothetical protein n=1 Tax=Sphingopyxis sp. BSN-002 TaxID=2911495 RepID=UPI001ED9DBB2|nr:hypothetical protein [Sphingopyxis sp. BSN-002]UKK85552.1 hypothetical protein L7H23_05450 [Sphingopyxis sp. BSN-002]
MAGRRFALIWINARARQPHHAASPSHAGPTHNPQSECLLAKQHEPDAPDDRKRHKYDPEADGRGSFAGTLHRIVKVRGFHCQMPRRAIFRAATKPAASSGTRAAATLNLGDWEARRSFFRIRRGTPIFASDLSTFGISISASCNCQDTGMAASLVRRYT